jgi:predicted PurR-regulated permease PerM
MAEPDARPARPEAPLLLLAAGVAVLYIGRDVLIPLALSILLAFLLAPAVMRLERARLGRIGATAIVVTAAFVVIGALLWLAGRQALHVVENLPEYRIAIRHKLDSLRGTPGGAVDRASVAVRELGADLGLAPPPPAPGSPAAPADPAGRGAAPADPGAAAASPATAPPSATAPAVAPPPGAAPPRAAAPPPAAPLSTAASPPPTAAPSTDGPPRATPSAAPVPPPAATADTLAAIRTVARPLLAPIATLGAVVVFTVVILMQRADLRDRLYRLAGQGRISTTASALDEAAERVARYLRMQVIINVSYGLPIGAALWVLGIPNAALWGILAAVLRFVPYVGPWVAAAFPLLLALATGDGWSLVLWTAAVFLALELVSNNVIEPWLYGASTGLSPVAILASALFWTWLWGLPGLLLAVPLTVCVAVIGRHIPQFAFLDVMLGDTPVLEPHERVYQRLLAGDEWEASEIVDAHVAAAGRADLHDAVLLPALALAERDRDQGRLERGHADAVVAAIGRLADSVAPEPSATIAAAAADDDAAEVVVVAVHDAADRIAASMLAQRLAERGVAVRTLGEDVLAAEAAQRVRACGARVVCVSSVPPRADVHAAYLCKRLRRACPDAHVLAATWDADGGEAVRARLREAGADAVAIRIDEAVEVLREWLLREGASVAPPVPETAPAGGTDATARVGA